MRNALFGRKPTFFQWKINIFDEKMLLFQWAVLSWSLGGLGVVLGWWRVDKGSMKGSMKGRRRIDEGWSWADEGSMKDRWRDQWRADEGSMTGSMKGRWRVDEGSMKGSMKGRWRIDEGTIKQTRKKNLTSKKKTTRQAHHQSNHSNKKETKRKNPKQETLHKKLCNSRSTAPGGCYVKRNKQGQPYRINSEKSHITYYLIAYQCWQPTRMKRMNHPNNPFSS